MRHAANRAGRAAVLRERQDVVPSRRLHVDEAIPAPVLTETKDLFVEPQCTFSVSNRKVDMCEASTWEPWVIHPSSYRSSLSNHGRHGIAEPLTHYYYGSE